MSEKTLKTRIQNKRGTTAEWATGTAPNFVPKAGEIVVYTDVHRLKVGDDTTKVSDLPFVDKVNDVTLDGESIVNANGVVELQQTEMTDGYIPVWDNAEKIFKDGYDRNNMVTIDGSQTITGLKVFNDTGSGAIGFTYASKPYATYIHPTSSDLTRNIDIHFPGESGTVMMLEGTQTITGVKTFSSEVAFNNHIKANNSAGTAGQVLTSQGANKAPRWSSISTPNNMVTTDTTQTITGSKTFGSSVTTNSYLNVGYSIIIDNGGEGIRFYNTNGSDGVTLALDETLSMPQQTKVVRLPLIEDDDNSLAVLIAANSVGSIGKVLTSAGTYTPATWSTLPAFAMNTALAITCAQSTSSNITCTSASYGTSSTTTALMTRNLADHEARARYIRYDIHYYVSVAAGKWVRFTNPSISYGGTTYTPSVKAVTASAIRSNTSTSYPAVLTYISGSYFYVGCCANAVTGFDIHVDCQLT